MFGSHRGKMVKIRAKVGNPFFPIWKSIQPSPNVDKWSLFWSWDVVVVDWRRMEDRKQKSAAADSDAVEEKRWKEEIDHAHFHRRIYSGLGNVAQSTISSQRLMHCSFYLFMFLQSFYPFFAKWRRFSGPAKVLDDINSISDFHGCCVHFFVGSKTDGSCWNSV